MAGWLRASQKTPSPPVEIVSLIVRDTVPPPSTLTPRPVWPVWLSIRLALTVARPSLPGLLSLPNTKWMPSPEPDFTPPVAVMSISEAGAWGLKCCALIAALDREVTVPVVVMSILFSTTRAHIA